MDTSNSVVCFLRVQCTLLSMFCFCNRNDHVCMHSISHKNTNKREYVRNTRGGGDGGGVVYS